MNNVLFSPTTPTRWAISSNKRLCCHVLHRGPSLLSRNIHSRKSAAPSAISPTPPAAEGDTLSKTRSRSQDRRFRPRQATFQTRQPNITCQKQVIDGLKPFRPTSKYWEESTQDRKQAIVILATPSFSKWLQDDSFIAGLLTQITRVASASENGLKRNRDIVKNGTIEPLEMDVLCACVDGISPRIDWFPHAKRLGVKHGFSILMGRASEILPNLWDTEESSTISSPTMTASLTFATARTVRCQSYVILPLANTLFSNGRQSTLLISKWRFDKDTFVKVSAVAEKRNQIINVFDGRSHTIPSVYVAAVPLTPARRIISGLGNIVRQIDFGNEDDEDAGPASRELEANMDDYLVQTRKEKLAIAVWALIIPKSSIAYQETPPPFRLVFDTDAVKSQWRGTPLDLNFIGYWLSRGAKFCRVLSGGGGWGVKQGLLSLDPQSTYGEVREARFDFSTGSLEEQQNSALGNIAETDAYVQFFLADDKITARPLVNHAKPPDVGIWQTSTVVGTVPSTIDDQRTDESRPENAGEGGVVYQPGHFGAVSEAGMFLSTDSIRHQAPKSRDMIVEKPPVHTKIDLPYSYIYRDFRREAKPERLNLSNPSTVADEGPELSEHIEGPNDAALEPNV